MIVGVMPATLTDGVETDVEVTVAYELDAQAEALLEIGSNSLSPRGFSPFGSQRITKGAGTITVRGKLTPRFWTNNIVPKISAFLVVPGDQVTQRKVAASDQVAIAVALRPGAAESQPVNPNPSIVYEDGLRIKSVNPVHFVAGQAADVEVVVSYELLSRETGEVSLLCTQGRPNGYVLLTKQQVSAGKGEVVLRGRVQAQRTGSLPFMKIQVNMSEFPRRPRTSMLGSDSETVEVR